jgi:hypothetical protein
MSWQIIQEGMNHVVVLDNEMGILQATDFHQAVLPLAAIGGTVRVDASAAKSIHSSIMQILYALAQAVPDFGVARASDDFRAAEVRVGYSFARKENTGISGNPAEEAEVCHG